MLLNNSQTEFKDCKLIVQVSSDTFPIKISSYRR